MQRFAPAPRSFVNALDFAGPAELAAFLAGLAGDPERYGAYQVRRDSDADAWVA
jgi:hypothetical protein